MCARFFCKSFSFFQNYSSCVTEPTELTSPALLASMNRLRAFSDPTEVLRLMDELDSDESDGDFDGFVDGNSIYIF